MVQAHRGRMMPDQKPTVAFISSPRFIEHDTGPHHPERPDRIRAIHRAVRVAGLIDSPDPLPDFELDLGPVQPSGFQVAGVWPRVAEEEWIYTVHPEDLVRRMKHVAEMGG